VRFVILVLLDRLYGLGKERPKNRGLEILKHLFNELSPHPG